MLQKKSIRAALRSLYSSSSWVTSFSPDGDFFQWAVVQKKSSGFVLQGYGTSQTADQALACVSGVANDAQYTISVLPSSSTLSRQISLPPLPEKDLRAAVLDVLDQTLAVGLEGGGVAYEVIASDGSSQTILAYLAREQIVAEHLSLVQSHKINPEQIFPKATCLGAFINHFMMKGWQYIVDISSKETTVALIFDGRVVESRSLTGNSDLFTSLGVPNASRDEELKNLLQSVAETLWSYKEKYEIVELFLTVTGNVLSSPIAPRLISEFISTPLSALHAETTDPELLRCSAAIGGAFLSQSSLKTPNFREGLFAYSNPLLHWKRPILAFCIGCIAAAALVLWYGERRANAIIEDMNNDWVQITKAAHILPEEIPALQSGDFLDTSEQLISRGQTLLSSLEKRVCFPLQPNVPRCVDILSWISQLIKDSESTPPMDHAKCEVTGFTYQMVKRPTKGHPKERYQVRVDLDFSTPSVALARNLHDRFTTNNAWVDPSSEVKWVPGSGKYRVSFFLKDKTIYPPQDL